MTAEENKCIDCKKYTDVCSMSLVVNQMVRSGSMENLECILRGKCVDSCPKDVVHYAFSAGKS